MARATTVQVVWKQGERFSVPAELVYERVKEIEGRDGVCSPAAFVESARPQDDPLHDSLEWDDYRAAESWRRHQARRMIGAIRIVGRGADEAPALVHCKIVSEAGVVEGYVDVERMRDDAEVRAFAIAEAKRYLRGARARYGHLNELAKVWAAIDELGEAA